MPPLRQRKQDIPLLINHYLKQINQAKNKTITGIQDQAMEILIDYDWPGNIRELVNFVERMVVLSSGNILTPRDLPDKLVGNAPEEFLGPLAMQEPEISPAEMLQESMKKSFFIGLPEEGMNLKQAVEDFERELISEALEKTNWVKNKAAGLLGLNRTTLVEKLKKMNIKRDE